MKLLFVSFAVLLMTFPTQERKPTVQCISESRARKMAEQTALPEYPEEADPGSSQGVVFATVLFGIDGKMSKIKFNETPNAQTAEAVKKAVEQWKLRELYDSALQPIMTRTGLRFHFVFEDGKGRVDFATEQEQIEFGGKWGDKVCKASLDDPMPSQD